MKRIFQAILLITLLTVTVTSAFAKDPEIYALRTYYFDNSDQETRLDKYLQNALLPALHRLHIDRVGVFKAMANDTTAVKKIILLIPFKSVKNFVEFEEQLSKDKEYLSNGADYINTVYSNPVFKRMETVLLKAFSKMPVAEKPQLKNSSAEKVYELRSYESASEKIYRNKVEMFNEGGEVALFKRLGFNAVFYGEVLAGTKMPNLMYMTSFENMEDRNAHWKTFSNDPEWKTLSGLPQYQKNVSRSEIVFLRATPYSDL